MAEAIARRMIARDRRDASVGSAGTSAWDGAPASDGAILVGIERQFELSQHRSRALSPDIIAASDLVLVMGEHHLERVNALGGEGKAHLLADYAAGEPTGRAIADPFGGDLDLYRATFDELEAMIARVLDRAAPAPGAGA